MDTLESLEQEILLSMVHYKEDIDEFLAITPRQVFSQKGSVILEKILTLQGKKALSTHSLMNALTTEQQSDEYVLELFSKAPNSSFVNLSQELITAYKLKMQKANGLKMIKASDNNTLLDLSMLDRAVESNEYKNLAQWIDYYATRPEQPKFKTKVGFLDSVFDGGIEVAQLVLISGDPEAGKTTLGLQVLENISHYAKVGFFSFEFTIEQYIRAKQAERKPPNLDNMYIINEGYELYTIAQNIKNLYRQGVKVFLIDSQMRITSPNGRNMEEEESLKFSLLAKLCHSLGILVFLIVQTSKSDRDNPMGSKKGGHEASIIIRIEHCKPEIEALREFSENSRMVILKKNKQTGKHFKEKVAFDPNTRKFASIEVGGEAITESVEMDKIIEVVSI
ncbi:ATPase domain-containing protein [Helicobacter canis]|uniref:Helicase DnaB n=1 Tax=Helicobacter canis TaxID=29419 RepID=A0A377J1C5_9HELI|nr:ATPase domain-containing protein [Helicobacter canis]STO96205.1 helicase DnaB [Helicobacter canis]STO96270.1 helicase DnaB [Helicobacter canis]